MERTGNMPRYIFGRRVEKWDAVIAREFCIGSPLDLRADLRALGAFIVDTLPELPREVRSKGNGVSLAIKLTPPKIRRRKDPRSTTLTSL